MLTQGLNQHGGQVSQGINAAIPAVPPILDWRVFRPDIFPRIDLSEFPGSITVLSGLDPAADPARVFFPDLGLVESVEEGPERPVTHLSGASPSADPDKVFVPEELEVDVVPEGESRGTQLSGVDPQPDPPRLFRRLR